MLARLSDSARRVLALAEEVARSFGHEYIGTEHILLGLIETDSGALKGSLQAIGVDPSQIRPKIEQLVQPGPQSVSQRKLPYTPRARRAIELADEDAQFLQQDRIGPEHLFFGVLREKEGVAGQVLLSLGLQPEAIAERVFNHRLMQLKYVERIVRPVRAGYLRKRKMREELLAHLTAIYEEQLARCEKPDAAWQATIARFGETDELSHELQNSLPLRERLNYHVERWVGWRPPESATRWMVRSALQTAALLAVLNIVAAISMVAALGWNPGAWMAIRATAAMSLLVPLVQFVLGTLYFKVRDATFGVFGSRKSFLRAFLLASLMGLTSWLACLSFAPLGYSGNVNLVDVVILAAGSLAMTFYILLLVRRNGPDEIRDTLWASMDIDAAPQIGGAATESA